MANRRRAYGPTFKWRSLVFGQPYSEKQRPPWCVWVRTVRLVYSRLAGAPRSVDVRVQTGRGMHDDYFRAFVVPPRGLPCAQTGGDWISSLGHTRSAALDALREQIEMHERRHRLWAQTLARLLERWPADLNCPECHGRGLQCDRCAPLGREREPRARRSKR